MALSVPPREASALLSPLEVTCFFVLPALALLGGGALIFAPTLLGPVMWMWLIFIEGPHLIATWQRAYLDGPLATRNPWVHVAGVVSAAAPLVLFIVIELTGQAGLLLPFLGLCAVLSFHHGERQFFGIYMILESRVAPRHPERRPGVIASVTLWVIFGLSLLTIAPNRKNLELDALEPTVLTALTLFAGGLVVLGTAYIALVLVKRWRACQPTMSLWFLLGPVIFASAAIVLILGPFEPLWPQPENEEQALMLITVVGGIIHGAHYFGVVTPANRRRYAGVQSRRARIIGAPLVFFALLVGASLLYGALNIARSQYPLFQAFAPDSVATRFAIFAYWSIFFHHFATDRQIWRVRNDPALRRELGLS